MSRSRPTRVGGPEPGKYSGLRRRRGAGVDGRPADHPVVVVVHVGRAEEGGGGVGADHDVGLGPAGRSRPAAGAARRRSRWRRPRSRAGRRRPRPAARRRRGPLGPQRAGQDVGVDGTVDASLVAPGADHDVHGAPGLAPAGQRPAAGDLDVVGVGVDGQGLGRLVTGDCADHRSLPYRPGPRPRPPSGASGSVRRPCRPPVPMSPRRAPAPRGPLQSRGRPAEPRLASVWPRSPSPSPARRPARVRRGLERTTAGDRHQVVRHRRGDRRRPGRRAPDRRPAAARPGPTTPCWARRAAAAAAAPACAGWSIPSTAPSNYLYGHPGFAVSIAAEVDGAVVAGVVLDPWRGEAFTRRRGRRGHAATAGRSG